jgi:glycine betaine/proline transport system permease protein
VLVSVIFCAIAGVPLGIAMAKSQRVRSAISPLLDLMQTIPSFVYLIPVAMLLGLGKVPAILATIIYALPPLARLTELGLRQIEPELLEAADAFGATAAQRLTSVELPLAVPSILQGINQTTMMALAMVVVASMIGAPGLGQTVLEGLQRADVGTGLIGGTAIVILAIVLDRITQAFGARKLASGQETAP